MTDEKKDKDPAPLTADRARQIILARRARFVAAALAGIGASGCDFGPSVCLDIDISPMDAGNSRTDAGNPRKDAGPGICLSIDSGPRVCLSPPSPCQQEGSGAPGCPPGDAGRKPDAGQDAGHDAGEGGVLDSGPQVCLTLLLRKADPEDEESKA